MRDEEKKETKVHCRAFSWNGGASGVVVISGDFCIDIYCIACVEPDEMGKCHSRHVKYGNSGMPRLTTSLCGFIS
jgi:hypothetical protein